jgi:hypothetical protein
MTTDDTGTLTTDAFISILLLSATPSEDSEDDLDRRNAV